MHRAKSTIYAIVILLAIAALLLSSCTKESSRSVLSVVSVEEPTVIDLPTETPIPLALVTDEPNAVKATAKTVATQTSDGGDDPQVHVLRIRAVGDLMMHDRQLRSAVSKDGSYDFTNYFAYIADEISSADIAIGNLETPIGTDRFSGFPLFKAPPAFLDVIVKAGFDAVSLANNHMLDQGMKGIDVTTQQLREKGLLYTGAGSEQENGQPLILSKNGIKVALLSYTAFSNSRPAGSEARLNFLEKQKIALDVQKARGLGADFIIAYVHWGNEYEQTKSAYQTQWAKTLADTGVDAILGAHPHVLQPIETITAADGRKVFCAFSLGNFISNQPDFPRYIGGIAELTLEKSELTGQTILAKSGFIPTWICRTIRADYTCDYTVLRADRLPDSLDEAAQEMARLKANGALGHAVGVLGKYGAQVIQ